MTVWRRVAGGLALSIALTYTGFGFAQAESPDQGNNDAENAPSYASGGAERCLQCHGADGFVPAAGILETAHARVANPHSPFAEGAHQCQSCHGPSAAHMSTGADGKRPPPPITFADDNEDPMDQNSVCLDCHGSDIGNHWAGSIHQFEELACSDCHQVHNPRDPIAARETQSDLCLDCHSPQRADFLRRSVHPVREGLQVCSDCHQPHGSPGPALLATTTVNDTCYECHAEKRGPFLWEHAPVREDCSNCHVPHGSNHESLLQARTPWLCQQCHLAQFHPSTSLDGTAAPPRGASQLLLGKDCMSCHSAIHGSNHPSGPGLVR